MYAHAGVKDTIRGSFLNQGLVHYISMASNKYTVQYVNGSWEVNSVGVPRLDTYPTKQKAVKAAKSRAKKYGDSKVEVYKKNGQLQDSFTYNTSKKSSQKSSGIFNDFF